MGTKNDEDLPHHKDTTPTFNPSSFVFGPFILHAYLEGKGTILMLSSKSKSESRTESGVVDDDQVVKLHSLGFPSLDEFEFIGSCNGLVCLYDRDHNRVSLWNPITRQFRNLPKPIHIDTKYPPRHLLTFGFDVETKDYKVMLLTGDCFFRKPVECTCHVQVYTLSTNSWSLLEGISKYFPGFPFPYSFEGGGLYLNGSCFFVAEFLFFNVQPCFPVSNRFIISLDLTRQIITPIQLPDHHRDDKLYLCYFGDDKIALFTAASPCYDNKWWKDDYEYFNIWVLNCDEQSNNNSNSVNKNSWTHFNSFRIQIRPSQWNLPRGISNDGKFVLLENMDRTARLKMKLYSLVTKKVKKNFLPRDSKVMSRANAFKPSIEPMPPAGFLVRK